MVSAGRYCAILCLASTVLIQSQECRGDSPCAYDEGSWGENVRYTHPVSGDVVNGSVQIPLSGIQDQGDAVTYRRYNYLNMTACDCTGRPTTCNGSNYEYSVVSIPNTFSFIVPFAYMEGGVAKVKNLTVTKAHVNAYYDLKYAGYDQEGDVDFSQNCHGYTFGTGNWIDDSMMFGFNAWIQCYNIDCVPSNAVLAGNTSHSMKCGGENCSTSETYMEKYTSSSEKFRGSRIYKQSGTCDSPVDLGKAHGGTFFTPYTNL